MVAKSNVVKHPSSKAVPAKTKKPAVKKAKGFTETVLMKLDKDTKGANVYKAVDAKGNALGQEESIMPSVYFRKSHQPVNSQFVRVTIESVDSLSAKPKVEADEGEED